MNEEYQNYMKIARERNDLLWKYHQEKREKRNANDISKEEWEKRVEYLLNPLRRKTIKNNISGEKIP